MPTLATRLLAGTAAALATVAVAAPATAAPAGPPAQHCAFDARTGRTECFASFTDAIATATGGRVLDAPADPRLAQADPALRSRLAGADAAPGGRALKSGTSEAEIVQGTFFEHPDYGGNSFTVHGAGLCDDEGGAADFVADFPADWHDTISSAQPWALCDLYLYSEVGQTGDKDGRFKENTAYIGDLLNDRVKSVSFH